MNRLLLLLICLFTLSAVAQTPVNRKAQQQYDNAQQYLRQNAFEEGINYLLEAVKADPGFQAAHIQLGDAYKRLKKLPEAITHYRRAISAASKTEARIFFALGESELQTGAYTPAKEHLLNYVGQTDAHPTLVQKAKKYIQDCDFALNALKTPLPFSPQNLGATVNSSYRDYFPALTADEKTLIFSRVVNGNEDFYTASKRNGAWQMAEPLSDQINTPHFNEGAQSISPDGRYLFFTGCNRPDGLGRCDIYLSRKEGTKWGKAINLGPIINSEYWEAQPAISPDGSTLYFVSNRPGGIGGYDIWKSTLGTDSKWTTPVNLGPAVNTLYDESTPFMHADGKTLYFSSDGWPGMGAKDIFFTRTDERGNWAVPLNLGYPINTFNEETGLIVTADGRTGFFSSDLAGGFGDVDLYRFALPENAKPLPVSYVKGIVKDRISGAALAANILVVDLSTETAVYNDETAAETGDFLTVLPLGTTYSFNVLAPGYQFYSAHYNLARTLQDQEALEIEIALDKIVLGAPVTLANVFFETNKYELLPASLAELSFLIEFLHQHPNVAIEIQGHTDDVGSEAVNKQLSLNRAKAVYNYLLENDIPAQRLRYKGFGSSQPKVANTDDEARSKNRRTAFIITKL